MQKQTRMNIKHFKVLCAQMFCWQRHPVLMHNMTGMPRVLLGITFFLSA
jgi:hypothetical protein